MRRKYFKLAWILLLFSIVLLSIPVIFQDFLIFPELFANPRGSIPELPKEKIERYFVETSDFERIEVWRMAAVTDKPRGSAIVFHGNSGNVSAAVFMQRRLSEAGFNTYSFDYRGYGQSSGWPSEQGLYLDARAVWDSVLKQENMQPQQIILVAHSLGTGIASQLAVQVNPGALLMFSPYSSLNDVVSERTDYRYYAPFLFYRLPTLEYLKRLESCILITHGDNDQLILPANSQRIASALAGRKNFQYVEDKEADHFNIFERDAKNLIALLPQCGYQY